MNSQTVRCPDFLFSLPEGDYAWDQHYGVPPELAEKCTIHLNQAPYKFVAALLADKVAPTKAVTNKCVYLISKDEATGLAILACVYDSKAWIFYLSY